jgi:hypothetical protein
MTEIVFEFVIGHSLPLFILGEPSLGGSLCAFLSVHLVWDVSAPSLHQPCTVTGHSGPTPHFDPSWACFYVPFAVSSAVVLSIGPPTVTVGFGPSEQLLGRDFSLRHDGGEGGCGKSEKGRKVTGCVVIRLRSEEGGGGRGKQAVVFILRA